MKNVKNIIGEPLLLKDVPQIKVKNLTKLYILALLKLDNAVSGYFIIKKLNRDLGKTVSPTYVYNFLKKLKACGFTEEVFQSLSKKRKGYILTSSGLELVNRVFHKYEDLIDSG